MMSSAANSDPAAGPDRNIHQIRPVQAVIIVDHGSRRDASNQMLLAATAMFAQTGHYPIVEAAHMELAAPDIATAFRNCVERGAEQVIVFPYFLSPGRHWHQDIPDLVAAAAADFPGTSWIVTAPFGLHPDMTRIIQDRIHHCLKNATSPESGVKTGCDACSGSTACQLHVV